MKQMNNSAFVIRKRIWLSAAIFVLSFNANAQKEFDGIRGTKNWIGYSDAPNALYHHIADQANVYLNKRAAKIAGIRTLAEWKQRQNYIRSTLRKAVGDFPEKTALNATITKTIEKDNYKVEHIVYESQPGYFVTSSLFIPKKLKNGKASAIIYCSGHSNSGYRAYQSTIINLVNKGFIVFAFDPIGQGERLQYLDEKTNKSKFKWPSYEHSYAGAQSFLAGNTIAANFTWDGIRAVDYLLTRREVDAANIGINGRSGGGTQSAFIAAFDERIKAVAPENYITNFNWLFRAMGPQDAEQNVFYGIEKGLDIADLLLVRAPKPALMITTSYDMFPIQGALETEKEVKAIYKAYGKPENFSMATDDTAHASTKNNREAMYRFFQKVLNNPGDATDEKVELLSEEELQVTKTGQVATAFRGESAYSLNAKEAAKKMKQLEAARTNGVARNANVVHAAKQLSGYREPNKLDIPMFAGRIQRNGYVIEKYLLKGEGNYDIPYLLLKPKTPSSKALLYLNPEGKTADVLEGGEMEWFVKNGFTVLAPDIIGTGELGPGDFKGDSYIDSVSFNIWFAGLMINRSIVGIQTGDVMKLVNILEKEKNIKGIFGLAKKQMSPLLLHAAAFNNNIKGIVLVEPYASYRSMIVNPEYRPDFLHSTVAGAIGSYDLPDLTASLAPKKLLIIGMTDGNGDATNTADIEKDLQVIRQAYKANPQKLMIVPGGSVEAVHAHYMNWINK